jgi:ABC-type polysaccharide/polyol phosphate export permease
MVAYLTGIWQCRYFWINLVRSDLRTRYRRSIFGLGWSLLHPIAMTAILCTVFLQIIMPGGNILEFAPFLLSGLATWSFFTSCTLHGCQCFFQGESYIRQFPAPMAIYPLRSALGAMVHFLIALTVVVGAVWIFRGVTPERALALLWLVPNVLLLFLFGWSLAVLAGLANVYFQDTQHLCEVGFQGLMYLTPVIYFPKLLSDRGMGWVVDCNPLAALMQLIRSPVLDGEAAPAGAYLLGCSTVAILFAAAALLLARFQRRIVFRL